MTLVNIFWYLSALFGVALIATSAITVAPGGEAGMRLELGVFAGGALLFAAIAVTLKRLGVGGPKWLLRLFQVLAVVATGLVLLIAAG
ncbi:MAG: hypothetical protein ABR915_12370 [Thermoguttaceae bacterium]|jgi:hypothetical protein